MPQGGGSARLYAICSDTPSNGKTLLARLLCGYLTRSLRAPRIFDAAQGAAGLVRRFPLRTIQVDLTSTAGQIDLFDGAVKTPLRDSVVDLPAHLLGKFFALMRDLGFGAQAQTPGVSVVVLFVVGRSEDSLLTARELRAGSNCERFILVRNEASVPDVEPRAENLHRWLARDGRLDIPHLDRPVMTAIEDWTLSFDGFLEDDCSAGSHPHREEILQFVSYVYHQLEQLDI